MEKKDFEAVRELVGRIKAHIDFAATSVSPPSRLEMEARSAKDRLDFLLECFEDAACYYPNWKPREETTTAEEVEEFEKKISEKEKKYAEENFNPGAKK